MDVSDKKIIQGIAQGGRERERMFEVLMLQTQRLLHAYLIKQFSISVDADRSDIIVDSYLSVDKQIRQGKFRGEMKLVNYLHIVVRHEALSVLKRHNKGFTVPVDDENYARQDDEIAHDALDDIMMEDCLQKALAGFKHKKPKQHQQLHRYMGCDHHQHWVEKYGGTARSSKDRLYRVRKSFEAFYELFCGKRK